MNKNKKWYKTWWAIVIWVVLGLAFLPFIIGGILIYFVVKKLKNSKVKLALALIIGFLTLCVGGGWLAALFNPSAPKEKTTNQQQEQQEEGKLREYKVVDRKVSEQVLGENLDEAFEESLKENPAKNKELVLRLVVPFDIDEKDLKFTVGHIINEETSKDEDLDEITVFVFDREQDINSAYTVARAIWAFEGELGKVTKEIAKSNDRRNYKITWSIKSRILTQDTFSTEEETEIYYRYAEIYSDITEKEGFDPLPKLGEKDAPTPKKDKAEKITAEEFNISTSELRKILDRVSKSKPSEEELRIFQTYDDKLNEAIDEESAGGEKVGEEKIVKEVAVSLGISPKRLSAIWTRVFAWQQEE